MAVSTYYKRGSWKARCDSCAEIFKSDQLRLQWDNYRVCATCWDYRHPQELLKVPRNQTAIPWSRPDIVPTYATMHHTGVIDSKASDRVGADMMTYVHGTIGLVSPSSGDSINTEFLITDLGEFLIAESGNNLIAKP